MRNEESQSIVYLGVGVTWTFVNKPSAMTFHVLALSLDPLEDACSPTVACEAGGTGGTLGACVAGIAPSSPSCGKQFHLGVFKCIVLLPSAILPGVVLKVVVATLFHGDISVSVYKISLYWHDCSYEISLANLVHKLSPYCNYRCLVSF